MPSISRNFQPQRIFVDLSGSSKIQIFVKSSTCRRPLKFRLFKNTHFFVKSSVCHLISWAPHKSTFSLWNHLFAVDLLGSGSSKIHIFSWNHTFAIDLLASQSLRPLFHITFSATILRDCSLSLPRFHVIFSATSLRDLSSVKTYFTQLLRSLVLCWDYGQQLTKWPKSPSNRGHKNWKHIFIALKISAMFTEA